jgi:hypothetical protein
MFHATRLPPWRFMAKLPSLMLYDGRRRDCEGKVSRLIREDD